MINELDVYLYGLHAATITRRGKTLRFTYLPTYLATPGAVPVSVQLPLQPGTHPSQIVDRFLDNLLPDRAGVKERWAREANLPSTEAFDLLTAYGADVTGALEFYPAGTGQQTHSALAPITETEIAARIRKIHEDDTDWVNRRTRNHPFSLGGAQGKFALTFRDGAWYEATGQHPSTHIFKPGVKGYPGSDITEHLTLRIAQQLGLPVARTDIGIFDGEHVLIVERFDRLHGDNCQILRLHQEDLAQATNTPALIKYDRDGGPSIDDVFSLLDRHLDFRAASIAKRQFAESLVFAWIIGHTDGHSKNYSLTHAPDGSFLSPLYDLNSQLPFELPSAVRARDYRAFDHLELSFTVFGATTIGEYTAHTLAQLSEAADLPAEYLEQYAIDVALRLQDAVRDAINTLPESLRDNPAVQLLPHATYAQTLRVRDVLDPSLPR